MIIKPQGHGAHIATTIEMICVRAALQHETFNQEAHDHWKVMYGSEPMA